MEKNNLKLYIPETPEQVIIYSKSKYGKNAVSDITSLPLVCFLH